MAMAYGDNWLRRGEHYSSAAQKGQWAQQQAAQQQQQGADWERGREMYERGLQQQEQQRRAYDSETARRMGEQKNSVLSGLIGQIGQGAGGMYSSMAFPAATGFRTGAGRTGRRA